MTRKNWSKDSWRNFPIKQQPSYDNQELLKKTEQELANFPPLVTVDEIEKLKNELAMVCNQKAFLLQCGDCAESFAEFSHDNLKHFFRTLMQMTATLMYGTKKPIVKVGRIAGQYAKPRSSGFEEVDNVSLPSYRGDIINSIKFEGEARKSDPKRLVDAYFYSSASLNYLRSLALGGYGSLKKINKWNEDFIHSLTSKNNLQDIVTQINNYLTFIEACGLDTSSVPQFTTANFYTSHEGLLLNYEQAFVNQDKETGNYYDQSSHMVWIGDRTRDLNEAHVEFMRGISNPIAFKVGPSISKDDLINLIEVLNPENTPGRITLISRMGAGKVEELLPPLVEEVKKANKNVVWSCDPMHGNTIKSSTGYKTRKFDDILSEIKSFFNVHRGCKTYAGGVHFEMTGQDVTECLGGDQQISDQDLKDRYHTHCDPRLNSNQSIELAFLIANELTKTS